jgi:hypothetical protein
VGHKLPLQNANPRRTRIPIKSSKDWKKVDRPALPVPRVGNCGFL